MTWTPPAKTIFSWFNKPSRQSPINATNLQAMENVIEDDTRTVVAAYDTYAQTVFASVGSNGTPTVVQAGNLGATYSHALSATNITWIVGTLNANCAVTLTGFTAGARGVLLLTQDGTGSRTLSVNGTSVPIPSAASAAMQIACNYDGTNLYVSVDGSVGGPPSGSAGGDLSGTYPNPTVAKLNGVAASAYALITENVNTVATAGAAQTLPDVSTDTIHYLTLTAALTLTFPTAAAGKSFLVALKQDSTPRAVTWPGTVKWPAGSAPTLTATSGKIDVFSFACVDGTNWLGLIVGQAF